jgi:L-ribulose-5-phosphate 3-epimerase
MTNPIGIMQGRLLPPTLDRIQAFPIGNWQSEFRSAAEAGLDCIEWIYEMDTADHNPLGTDAGMAEIHDVIKETGVEVLSVCGDYYMPERLVALDGTVRRQIVEHLFWMIERASLVGARHLVLPFVDASSLSSRAELNGLLEVLKLALPAARRAGIGLHLETDLPAEKLAIIVQDEGTDPLLRITCDIGNEASLGILPEEHYKELAPMLGSVHVKDRSLGGGTVPLGQGDADFDAVFGICAAISYEGTFILQVARGQEGDELGLAKRNREIVERHWQEALKHKNPRPPGNA